MLNLFSSIGIKAILIALACVIIGFFALSYINIKKELESARTSLELAENANASLLRDLEALRVEHEKQLSVLENTNAEKSGLNARVNNVKSEIYKSDESDIIKLFNDSVYRLWQ